MRMESMIFDYKTTSQVPSVVTSTIGMVGLPLLIGIFCSQVWAQVSPKTNDVRNIEHGSRAPECGELIPPGSDAAQMEAACEPIISKLEKRRQELVLDRLNHRRELEKLDGVLCYYKDNRRNLRLKLGRDPGPLPCAGRPRFHGIVVGQRRDWPSGRIKAGSDVVGNNWAGAVSGYPLFDSESRYSPIDDETTTITLPASVGRSGD